MSPLAVPASELKVTVSKLASPRVTLPSSVVAPVTSNAPVTLVLSCSSMVPAELRTMLPDVVVVKSRLPLVTFRAADRLVLAILLRLVVA